MCTQNRACLFGEIAVGAGPCACPKSILNDAGQMVAGVLREIPNYYPGNGIDEFVVMPNHVHAIIVVGADPRAYPETGFSSPTMPCHGMDDRHINAVGAGLRACPDNGLQENGQPQGVAPDNGLQENGQPQGVAPTGVIPTVVGAKGLALPDIVHRVKTLTTKRYADGVRQRGWQPFYGRMWQRNYYEHIVRDDDELNRVREYIRNNPANWETDAEFPGFAR